MKEMVFVPAKIVDSNPPVTSVVISLDYDTVRELVYTMERWMEGHVGDDDSLYLTFEETYE